MNETTTPPAPAQRRILRLPDVIPRTGLSRTSIYRKVAANTFPKPVDLGVGVGWFEHEIEAWMDGLSAARQANPPSAAP